jgi:hypothetical protein
MTLRICDVAHFARLAQTRQAKVGPAISRSCEYGGATLAQFVVVTVQVADV